jgi:predicted metalloprotease with PDZ domain
MKTMKRPSIALPLLAVLATAAPRDATAQQPGELYETRECGRIGIAFAQSDPLVVEFLMSGSPAARAGIQPHDTVLAIDGTPASTESLSELPERLRPGEPIRLRLRRDGNTREVAVVPMRDICVRVAKLDKLQAWSVGAVDSILAHSLDGRMLPRPPLAIPIEEVLAELEHRRSTYDSLFQRMYAVKAPRGRVMIADPNGTSMTFRFGPEDAVTEEVGAVYFIGRRAVAGAEFAELNPQLAAYFGEVRDGLLVLSVAPGTPAQRTGLQPGDVVTAVDDEPVRSIPELRAALARAGREEASISIVRRGESIRLTYRPQP